MKAVRPPGSKRHYHSELLERAVKLCVRILAKCTRIEWDFLPDPAEAGYKVEGEAVHWLRRHFIDNAGAREADPLCFEPVPIVPILRKQVFTEGKPKGGEVEIAAIIGFNQGVVHSDYGFHLGFRWQRRHDYEMTLRSRRQIRAN